MDVLPPSSLNSQFLMAAIYFVTVCKELKIAKIAQINQLVQFLNLICANGDAFYELTHMLMNINVKMTSADSRAVLAILKKLSQDTAIAKVF